MDKQSTYSHWIGLFFSLALIIGAYIVVIRQWLSGYILIAAIIALALGQALVQLFCFMHLHQEHKPRWNLMTFLFMGLVLLMIVIGSLWIMENINYHMSPS